jgi:hypothetical protein
MLVPEARDTCIEPRRGIAAHTLVCAPMQTTQIPICRDFYRSDGTRTRDLRRDRTVLALAG